MLFVYFQDKGSREMIFSHWFWAEKCYLLSRFTLSRSWQIGQRSSLGIFAWWSEHFNLQIAIYCKYYICCQYFKPNIWQFFFLYFNTAKLFELLLSNSCLMLQIYSKTTLFVTFWGWNWKLLFLTLWIGWTSSAKVLVNIWIIARSNPKFAS